MRTLFKAETNDDTANVKIECDLNGKDDCGKLAAAILYAMTVNEHFAREMTRACYVFMTREDETKKVAKLSEIIES